MRLRASLLTFIAVAALSLPALQNGLAWDDLEFTFARGGRLWPKAALPPRRARAVPTKSRRVNMAIPS